MKLKMLVSFAGPGFALSVGDETDRFPDKEAKRLIAEGYAERAPIVEPRKPATKAEWDDERRKLLDENAGLKKKLSDAQERESALQEELAGLVALKATVVAALAVAGSPDVQVETATQSSAPETRG